MANIDDYLVASYRCNGKGNSDADRDVLMELFMLLIFMIGH